METTINEAISEETSPILQLKRALLPIDEYAAREGISKGIVEECGRLGIVQIRKYKGKTFVVDVPFSPYGYASEIVKEPTQPISKTEQAKRISELVQRILPDVPEVAEETTKSTNVSVEPGAISKLVKRMFSRTSKIKDNPIIEIIDDETAQTENISDPIQITHREAPELTNSSPPLTDAGGLSESIPETIQMGPSEELKIINEPTLPADDEIKPVEEIAEPVQMRSSEAPGIVDEPTAGLDEHASRENLSETNPIPDLQPAERGDEPPEFIDEFLEIQGIPESVRVPQSDGFRFGILTTQAKSKRAWQVAAVFAIIFLFGALFTNLWFYMDRQIQLNRLEQAYASIQKVYNDFTQTRQQAEAVQNELDKSRAEVGRLQNELDKSEAEVASVRNELTRTRQDLEIVQQRNAEAVERLNEQVQKLMQRLGELTEKR
jgi:uncharacterized membrane protein YciS (DUF1049 family)